MNKPANSGAQTSGPMVFLRTGWMDRYRGMVDDKISGGGAYVRQCGYGGEVFNFEPIDGRVYGYVRPVRGRGNRADGSGINIERLGTSLNDQLMEGVHVVWVATRPTGGSFIVGWYQNATLYRECQHPISKSRQVDGNEFGFYVTAEFQNANLLPVDERVFQMPSKGKGGMGQSNVWYCDSSKAHEQLQRDVRSFIASPRGKRPRARGRKQPDIFIRQQVEKAAIKTVSDYYESLGYEIVDRQLDNVGWDLDAIHVKHSLKVEVKGLAAAFGMIELTPNEYMMMSRHRDTYRLAVVNDALTTPKRTVFAYANDSGLWEDQTGRHLEVEERVAARCSLVSRIDESAAS
jgi:hypothetical protein